MKRPLRICLFVASLILLAQSSCKLDVPVSPDGCEAGQTNCVTPLPSTCRLDPSAPLSMQAAMLAACTAEELSLALVNARPRRDVDVLFVVDNSPSMAPKQKALGKILPRFVSGLDELNVNYHIGVIGTDLGSNVADGQPWGGNIGACDTWNGEDGQLQALPCTARSNGTADARNACTELCPRDRFVPADGYRFISKIDGVTNVPVELQLDPRTGKMVDRGPGLALQCISLLGDGGCGIESQLESAKRALDGHASENARFLRPGSTLAVIFLTDEDDCSVQLARRKENNPTTRDCNPNSPDDYDCYNVDYRCLARSLECSESMLTVGVKTRCVERPNNYLEPIDKYVKFFSALRPRGQLILGGIYTVPSISAQGKVEITRTGGGMTTPFLNRGDGTAASCYYAGDSKIYGQAQLRMSKLMKGFPGSVEASVCDIDNYGSSLDQITRGIGQKITASCLSRPPKQGATGPLCLVGPVSEAMPTATPEKALPRCSASCCAGWANTATPLVTDGKVQAACMAETSDCYCAEVSRAPNVCTDGAVAGVWWKSGQPPVGKVASFRCVN